MTLLFCFVSPPCTVILICFLCPRLLFGIVSGIVARQNRTTGVGVNVSMILSCPLSGVALVYRTLPPLSLHSLELMGRIDIWPISLCIDTQAQSVRTTHVSVGHTYSQHPVCSIATETKRLAQRARDRVIHSSSKLTPLPPPPPP